MGLAHFVRSVGLGALRALVGSRTGFGGSRVGLALRRSCWLSPGVKGAILGATMNRNSAAWSAGIRRVFWSRRSSWELRLPRFAVAAPRLVGAFARADARAVFPS